MSLRTKLKMERRQLKGGAGLANSLRKTPIYPLYERFQARVIDFHGWALPVQFTGIMKEHEAVRRRAGLFDVSHMGQVMVEGEQAETFLQRMLTNDLTRLEINRVMYSAMCNEEGGILDDLLVYRLSASQFLLVLNAANVAKDVAWLEKHNTDKLSITNISNKRAILALQGPKAEAILQKLTDEPLANLGSFECREMQVAGVKMLVSRTGYTGEDGFELYLAAEAAPGLWEKLLASGEEAGLIPCGLGARDTLRLEAGLLLYGQDVNEEITPLEAGIAFAVKLNKEIPFIGQEALERQKEKGLARKLVGLEVKGRGIAREGYPVYAQELHNEQGQAIGRITSGTHSPTLKKSIAFALLDAAYTALGTKVYVEIRGKRVEAEVVSRPFYRRG